MQPDIDKVLGNLEQAKATFSKEWASVDEERRGAMISEIYVMLCAQEALLAELKFVLKTHKVAIEDAQHVLGQFDRAFKTVWERVTGEELKIKTEKPKVH